MEMSVVLKDILRFLGAEGMRLGRADRDIKGVSSMASAKEGDLTFCSYLDAKGIEMVNRSGASAVICYELLKGSLLDMQWKYIVASNKN